MYSNNLAFLNSKSDLTQYWHGTETYSNNLDSVKNFFTKKVPATPYKELSDKKAAQTITETFKKAITSAQTLK